VSGIDLTAAVEAAWDALADNGDGVDHRVNCGDECLYRHYASTALTAAAPLIEAAVREQIHADVVGVALEYRATCDAMRATALSHEPHDFGADDITRYGAYASAWQSAAARIARGQS
jgi:hypothetical protein